MDKLYTLFLAGLFILIGFRWLTGRAHRIDDGGASFFEAPSWFRFIGGTACVILGGVLLFGWINLTFLNCTFKLFGCK